MNLFKLSLVIVITLLFVSQDVSAWGNTTFNKCRYITINNSLNGNTLSNFPMPFNVTNTTNMDTTFYDLWVSNGSCDNANTSAIPFWIESNVSNSWANLYVNVSSITASGFANISIYYNNASFVNYAGNGSKVFDIFDAFDGNALDTDKWLNQSEESSCTGACEAKVSNGVINITAGTGGGHFIVSKNALSSNNTFVTLKIAGKALSPNANLWRMGYTNNTAVNKFTGNIYDNYDGVRMMRDISGAYQGNDNVSAITAFDDASALITITRNQSYQRFDNYSKQIVVGTTGVGINVSQNNYFALGVTYNGQIPTWYTYDYIFGGKSASPYPSYIISSEMSQTGTDTTPPNITISSPLNTTYNSASQWFNLTASEALSSAWFSLDGTANKTMTNSSGNWNYQNTSITEGIHNIRFFANDTAGNLNNSLNNIIYFTIDTLSPSITIASPTNTTYNITSIWFNITLSEAGSWAGYSLDNAANVSMTNSSGNWNALNSSMKKGTHTVKFFANDTAGNMNSTNVSFTIDLPNSTLNSFAINDTYINFNESVLLTINASGNANFADFSVELQTSSGLKNATIGEVWNSSSGLYTLIINATDLGNQSANATTINITKIYTLEGNYSAQANATSLNFSYGTTALTIISYSPTDTYNDTSITITAAYNTTNATAISSACNITRGGNNYAMTFATNKFTGAIPTGALDGEYSFGVTCSNMAYQSQTNLSAGSFIVRVGQGGGDIGGGGSSGSNIPSQITNATNNTNGTYNITTQQNNLSLPMSILSQFQLNNSALPQLNVSYVTIKLEKQIKDFSAPALGWIAPKKVFNRDFYFPNWSVALIIAGLTYFGMGGLKSNSAFQDKVMVILLPIFVFIAVLYFLIVII